MDKLDKDYLKRLTEHKDIYKWKLVKCPSNESWYPDWETDDGPCFLIFIEKTMKKYRVKNNQYFIYCCGVDDFEMAIRDINIDKAKDIFKKVKDGISQEQLEQLEIVKE